MKEAKEFDIQKHFKDRYRGRKRVPMSLELYDRTIIKLIAGLQEAISSPDNDTGVTHLVLFGSWARRDPFTGPTARSDVDLLAYKSTYLVPDGQEKMEVIVRESLARMNFLVDGIRFKEIAIFSGIEDEDLGSILQGDFDLTQLGYIIVPPICI